MAATAPVDDVFSLLLEAVTLPAAVAFVWSLLATAPAELVLALFVAAGALLLIPELVAWFVWSLLATDEPLEFVGERLDEVEVFALTLVLLLLATEEFADDGDAFAAVLLLFTPDVSVEVVGVVLLDPRLLAPVAFALVLALKLFDWFDVL